MRLLMMMMRKAKLTLWFQSSYLLRAMRRSQKWC